MYLTRNLNIPEVCILWLISYCYLNKICDVNGMKKSDQRIIVVAREKL